MTSTYPRPTHELLKDAVAALSETFTTDDAIRWFAENYPLLSANSIIMHLVAASVNRKPRPGMGRVDRQLLYNLGRNQYTRYKQDLHGRFDEAGRLIGASDENEASEDTEHLSALGIQDVADRDSLAQFALEVHLEEFMEENWSRLDFGVPLRLDWHDGGVPGRQYDTDVGTIDFLCKDASTGDFWVIELKRGRSSDRVVGQIARYMGWVQEHLANGQPVHGLIVTHEQDERLRYAVRMLPNVQAWTYRVNFEFHRESAE